MCPLKLTLFSVPPPRSLSTPGYLALAVILVKSTLKKFGLATLIPTLKETLRPDDVRETGDAPSCTLFRDTRGGRMNYSELSGLGTTATYEKDGKDDANDRYERYRQTAATHSQTGPQSAALLFRSSRSPLHDDQTYPGPLASALIFSPHPQNASTSRRRSNICPRFGLVSQAGSTWLRSLGVLRVFLLVDHLLGAGIRHVPRFVNAGHVRMPPGVWGL